MAKKSIFDYDKWERKHVAQMGARSKAIKKLFDNLAHQASLLGIDVNLESYEEFYLKDYPVLEKRIDELVKEVAKKVTREITDGEEEAWLQANAKNDALVDAVVKGIGVPEEIVSQWKQPNLTALSAFQARKIAGMGLSKRVWALTKSAKQELELALDIGLGEGKSAAELSRDIRQYLNEPDKLFRRVRDKHGILRLSKAAQAYHPGRGVYRSSYKNALRLTQTEINMAYRSADHERWAQEPWVIGQRVCLSNNHTLNGLPFHDICDDVQGVYPKDFKFVGWHPKCRCYKIPELAKREERVAYLKKMVNGEDVSGYKFSGEVKKVPEGFDKWMKDNAERISGAEARGKLPYFLRDNGKFFTHDKEGMLKLAPRKKTPLEIAEERHAMRTPEQVKAIIHKYNERLAIRKYGQSVLNQMKGITGVDTKDLEKALMGGNVSLIEKQAKGLKAIGKEILSYNKLDNPLQVARMTSMQTAKIINENVERTLNKMPTDLAARKAKLEFEIKWMENTGSKRYPDTWKFSQDAYKKELAYVQNKLDVKQIVDSVESAIGYSVLSRSKDLKVLADEMRAILASPNIDIAVAKAKAQELNNKYNALKAKLSKKTNAYNPKKIKLESIEDLKKRLGDNFPKTLPNLERAIAEYEKTSKYGNLAKQHKEEIEELMRRVFDEHDLGMNIDDDVLEAVLDSWFKNTFETGSSGGYLGSYETTGKIESSHGRLQTAHKLFGLGKKLDIDQLARHEYEKYGNLLDHDIVRSMTHNTATSYGNVEVRFKKDKVVATWTAGDSLGVKYQPSLVSDPRSCSFDDLYNTPTSASIQTSDLTKFKQEHIRGYIELQFHGDLTIDCVESLTFPYNLKKTSHSHHLSIAQKWKAKGVNIYYIDNGMLYQL